MLKCLPPVALFSGAPVGTPVVVLPNHLARFVVSRAGSGFCGRYPVKELALAEDSYQRLVPIFTAWGRGLTVVTGFCAQWVGIQRAFRTTHEKLCANAGKGLFHLIDGHCRLSFQRCLINLHAYYTRVLICLSSGVAISFRERGDL